VTIIRLHEIRQIEIFSRAIKPMLSFFSCACNTNNITVNKGHNIFINHIENVVRPGLQCKVHPAKGRQHLKFIAGVFKFQSHIMP
jgi:hypothetical protein